MGVLLGELILQNLWSRRARAILTAVAVAVGITTVVALGVLTYSLEQSAMSILRTGKADFSVAQKGVSDLLYSAVDSQDLAAVRAKPGVESAIGVLVAATDLDSSHPLFLQIGIEPDQLAEFGVTVVDGVPFAPTAKDELMLGFRAASDLGKKVGDQMSIGDDVYRVVGIFSTGQVFGDSAAMLPLPTLQASERKGGTLTLIFVRVQPGTDIDALRSSIEQDRPQLATVRSQSDFGRVDRNLVLIQAASLGGSVLAITIGAIGVMNTTLLSFFERIREFGLLRAIGWSRWRIWALVLGEAASVAFVGAAVGVGLGMIAIEALQQLPDLKGVFNPELTSGVFLRALGFAALMTLLGATWPAMKAARISPLQAISHE